MNQARNRSADDTLLLHAASSLYIKMVAQGWPGSCNTGIKVNSAELASLTNWASPGHYNQAVTVSCIVTQFARESFGICHFCGSCMKEIDLI